MFNCNDCNGCCEDTATQINLTIGDIYRLSCYLDKSPLIMYKENIIGIYPFADSDGSFELDLGLKIPCTFREIVNHKTKIKQCSSYIARPLNCRLFPYWILASAPEKIIDDMKINHPCGKALKNSVISNNDKNIYKEYVNYLSLIMEKENIYTEFFWSTIKDRLPDIDHTVNRVSIEENRIIINKIVLALELEDFSYIFKQIELEIKKLNNYNREEDHLLNFSDIKTLDDYYKNV